MWQVLIYTHLWILYVEFGRKTLCLCPFFSPGILVIFKLHSWRVFVYNMSSDL